MSIAEKRNVPRRTVLPSEKIQAQILTDTMYKLVGRVADISRGGFMLILKSTEFIDLAQFKSHFIEPSTTVEIQMNSGARFFAMQATIRWIGELAKQDDGLKYALGIQFKDEAQLNPEFIELVDESF